MKKMKVIFDRYEEDQAIFKDSSKEEIVLPAATLEGLNSGDSFEVTIKNEEEAKASNEELAKIILNDILGS